MITMDDLRRLRNTKLAQSDWRMVSDYPHEDQSAWISYRSALRDLPQNSSPDENGNLTNINWPTPPEN